MKTNVKSKICLLLCLLVVLTANAQVPEFDSDKPFAAYNSMYTQAFNTACDNTTFYGQWNSKDMNMFSDLSKDGITWAEVGKEFQWKHFNQGKTTAALQLFILKMPGGRIICFFTTKNTGVPT